VGFIGGTYGLRLTLSSNSGHRNAEEAMMIVCFSLIFSGFATREDNYIKAVRSGPGARRSELSHVTPKNILLSIQQEERAFSKKSKNSKEETTDERDNDKGHAEQQED
jgi:hypothetical protein